MKRAFRTPQQTPQAPMILTSRTIGSVLVMGVLLLPSMGIFVRSAEGQNLSLTAQASRTRSAHAVKPNAVWPAVAGQGLYGAKMAPQTRPDTAASMPLFLQPALFLSGVNNNASPAPAQTVSADFNGDGNADFAATIAADNAVSVMLGNGKGRFSAPVEYSTGSDTPIGLAVGDFNNDGISDLAVAAGGHVYFLTGNGDGTFQQPVQVASLTGTGWGLTVGDFNNDGNLDLGVAADGNGGAESFMTVLLGNGNGTFQRPVKYGAGGAADLWTVVAGDFNGDGKLDLAAVTSDPGSSLQIFLGNGDGTFTAGVNLPTSFYYSYSVAVGDFNGDGKLDVAVASACGDVMCYNAGSISVYLGKGNGTFGVPVQLESILEYSPWSLAVADYNGDGHLDIATQGLLAGAVYVFFGNGKGAFQAATSYVTEEAPYSIVAADFNNDKHIDLLTSDLNPWGLFANPPSVALLLNDGKGAFDSGTAKSIGADPAGIAIGDLSGNKKLDLVIVSSGDSEYGQGSEFSVLKGNGNGTFKPAVNYPLGDSYDLADQDVVALGDFTGKGHLDVAVAEGTGLEVFLNNGKGTFGPGTTYPTNGGYNFGITVGDFRGDGKVDIAIAEGSNAVVFLGNGDGTFQAATFYPVGGNAAVGIGVGDFNGDGKLDLVVANWTCISNPNACTVSVLLGNGDGTFRPNVDYPAGAAPYFLAVADLNGDGKLDLVVGQQADQPVNVLLGNGDGTFQPPTTYAAGYLDSIITVADVNGDGIPDIIDGDGVLFGNGDGTFQPLVSYLFGYPSGGIAAADLNGDGAIDVVTSNSQMATSSVLLNITGARVTLASTPNPSQPGQSVTFTATVAASVENIGTTPKGNVTFKDGSIVLGTSALVNGVTTLKYSKLSSGKHKIVAQYSGHNNFQPSSSKALVQVVK
jgi:hypothetical protein